MKMRRELAACRWNAFLVSKVVSRLQNKLKTNKFI